MSEPAIFSKLKFVLLLLSMIGFLFSVIIIPLIFDLVPSPGRDITMIVSMMFGAFGFAYYVTDEIRKHDRRLRFENDDDI